MEHAEAASLYPGAPLAALVGLAYVEAERWGDAEAALGAARLPDVAHDAEAARASLAFLR